MLLVINNYVRNEILTITFKIFEVKQHVVLAVGAHTQTLPYTQGQSFVI